MNQIVALISAHSWLALAVIVVGYLMRLFAPDSKFPITIPKRWAPAVTLGLGQIYGVLIAVSGGADWVSSVESGLSASFLVVVVQTLFDGAEPAWFKAIAFVISDAAGGPPAATGTATGTGVSPAEKSPPVATRRIAWLGVFAAALFGCAEAKAILTDVQIGCTAEALATSVIPPNTPAAQVAADIEIACNITMTVDTDVQAIVNAYEANQAEAGVTATAYVPSPMATKKRAGK
jgi:hypothetical protein